MNYGKMWKNNYSLLKVVSSTPKTHNAEFPLGAYSAFVGQSAKTVFMKFENLENNWILELRVESGKNFPTFVLVGVQNPDRLNYHKKYAFLYKPPPTSAQNKTRNEDDLTRV